MSTRGWFMARGSPAWADDRSLVRLAGLDEVDRVAHEQADVVEGFVELAERGEFSSLPEPLLFVAQFLFALLHLGRVLAQVSHDVNHGFAAGPETQLLIVPARFAATTITDHDWAS